MQLSAAPVQRNATVLDKQPRLPHPGADVSTNNSPHTTPQGGGGWGTGTHHPNPKGGRADLHTRGRGGPETATHISAYAVQAQHRFPGLTSMMLNDSPLMPGSLRIPPKSGQNSSRPGRLVGSLPYFLKEFCIYSQTFRRICVILMFVVFSDRTTGPGGLVGV
jgi:hypothetical protein